MRPKLSSIECPVCGDKDSGIRGLGDICFSCDYEAGFDNVEEYQFEWAIRCGLPPRNKTPDV